MHRSTTVTLAYQWWIDGWHLDEAFENLTTERECAMPGYDIIRQATRDMLYSEDQAALKRAHQLRQVGTRLTDVEAAKIHAILSVSEAVGQ